jgi:hypothetical protein
MNDLAKDCIERALRMPKTDIAHFLTMTDAPDQRPDTALFIEVAKKAGDETRMDIPRSIISHALRKRKDRRSELTCDVLVGILKNNSLPTPAEQANNFITFLGERLSSPGDRYEVFAQQNTQQNIYGILGLKTGPAEEKDFHFIITALNEQNLLNVNYSESTSGGR